MRLHHDKHHQAYVDKANGALDGAASFRYLRFRDPPYDDAGLAALADEIRPLLAAGIEVFGYFKHEDEPTAPRYAERLVALL